MKTNGFGQFWGAELKHFGIQAVNEAFSLIFMIGGLLLVNVIRMH